MATRLYETAHIGEIKSNHYALLIDDVSIECQKRCGEFSYLYECSTPGFRVMFGQGDQLRDGGMRYAVYYDTTQYTQEDIRRLIGKLYDFLFGVRQKGYRLHFLDHGERHSNIVIEYFDIVHVKPEQYG